jgi:hypothetical protein
VENWVCPLYSPSRAGSGTGTGNPPLNVFNILGFVSYSCVIGVA